MAEDTGFNYLQEQVHAMQKQLESLKAADTVIPKWWEEEKKTLDAKFAKNQKYFDRVLELMMLNSEAHAKSGSVHPTFIPPVQVKKDDKKLTEITASDNPVITCCEYKTTDTSNGEKKLLAVCNAKLYGEMCKTRHTFLVEKAINAVQQCSAEGIAPQSIGCQILETVSELKETIFSFDQLEKLVGDDIIALIQHGKNFYDYKKNSEFEFFHQDGSRLDITSSRAILIEGKVLKKLMERACVEKDKWKESSSLENRGADGVVGVFRLIFKRRDRTDGRALKLVILKGKQSNALFYSLSGYFIILAGLKGFNFATTNKSLIAIIENCLKITILNIESCPKIGKRGLQAIGKLCPKLQSICIEDCLFVGHHSVLSLMSLASSVLSKVKLQGLKVTDFSLAVIEHYGKSMKILIVIGLQNGSEKGFQIMSNAQGLKKLVSLMIISSWEITDWDLEAIGNGCANLKQICLHRCCFVSNDKLVAFAKFAGSLDCLQIKECNNMSSYLSSKKTMEINLDCRKNSTRKRAKVDKNDKSIKDLDLLLYKIAFLTSAFSLDDPYTIAARFHKMLKMGLSNDEDETSATDDVNIPSFKARSAMKLMKDGRQRQCNQKDDNMFESLVSKNLLHQCLKRKIMVELAEGFIQKTPTKVNVYLSDMGKYVTSTRNTTGAKAKYNLMCILQFQFSLFDPWGQVSSEAWGNVTIRRGAEVIESTMKSRGK